LIKKRHARVRCKILPNTNFPAVRGASAKTQKISPTQTLGECELRVRVNRVRVLCRVRVRVGVLN